MSRPVSALALAGAALAAAALTPACGHPGRVPAGSDLDAAPAQSDAGAEPRPTHADAGPLPDGVSVTVVPGGDPTARAADLRRAIVAPGINQPAPFPGYRGFVGWESPLRLANGTWLVGFSAGYWHVSAPTPLRIPPDELAAYRRLGMPADVDAPTGGRAMLVRSTDQGATWSAPETLLDTPWDDRHPSFLLLPDGTILCTLFTYPGSGDFAREPDLAPRTAIVRSTDGGRTWEQTPRRLPSPFLYDATDGPPILLADGAVLLLAYGSPAAGVADQIGVFRSEDGGATWALTAVVKAPHEMSESSVAQLPNGRLVLLARSEGDVAFSDDFGRTWTPPRSLGVRMFEPGLLALRDGTLLAIHGSYAAGGLRALLSVDGGVTWMARTATVGFAIDASVYGYAKGMELPDGSVFLVYIDTGGHKTHDAANEAIWSLRLRVRPDGRGIDLLAP